MRTIHYLIATFLGSGYFPKAPGTAGSFAALALFWLLLLPPLPLLALLVILFFTGVLSASYVEREEGTDPGKVVIDEVVGQGVALLFVPHQLIFYGIAFVLFRIFDIWKPFPIKLLERLPAGWGIMADDVMAGVYANLIIQFILLFGLFNGTF